MKILYNGSPIFLISGSGKPEPAQMQQMLEMWSMQGHSLPFLPTIPDYFSLTLLCLPHFFSLFYAFHLFTPQCRHFSLWEGFLSSEMKYTQDQNELVWLQTTMIKIFQTVVSLSKLDYSILAAIRYITTKISFSFAISDQIHPRPGRRYL